MPFIPAHFDSADPRMRFDNPNLFWDDGLLVEGTPMPNAQIRLKLEPCAGSGHVGGVKDTPRFDAILFWSTTFAGWTRCVAGLRA